MADGDAVPDGENWLRVLTYKNHIAEDGTVSEQALKKLTRAQPGRPWAHELSGRRLSLCRDVGAEARDYIEKVRNYQLSRGHAMSKTKFHFAGLAYAPAGDLRGAVTAHINADVIHTPIPPPDPYADDAHTDLVTFGSTDDDLDEVRTHLQSKLKVLTPEKLDELSPHVPQVMVQDSGGPGTYAPRKPEAS